MKYETELGGNGRTTGLPTARRELALQTLRVLTGGALVVAAFVVAGLAFVYAVELVGASVPVVLFGWMASVAVAVALPFLVVRGVGALLAVVEV